MNNMKYKNLNITDFANDDEFIFHMVDIAKTTGEPVALYAKSDYIIYVMKELMFEYEYEVGILDVYGGIYDEECYGSEYLLTIDKDGYVCAEQVWGDTDVKISDAVVNFVHQDHASQDLIDALLNRYERVVLFGVGKDECECDHDCEHCHIHETDEVPVGIPADKVVKDTESKELKEQAARDAMIDYYSDVVADMSKKFTDVLDEVFTIVRKHFDN